MSDESAEMAAAEGTVAVGENEPTATAVGSESTPAAATLESTDMETTANDGIRLYDFRHPSRVAGDRLRTLSAMHEILAASLSEWLTARLREQIGVSLGGFEETTFGEIVSTLPKPCAVYHFEVTGTPALSALISLEGSLAFAAVDRLLGGTREAHVEERALTGLEQRVAGVIADRLRIATETIWKGHTAFRLTPQGFESVPDLLQVAERPDPFLASRLHMKAPGWEGQAVVYLPFGLLEAALGVGSASEAEAVSPAEERRDVESALVAASVSVDVRFPAFPLPLGIIGTLREGMVLRTRIPVDAHLDVSICGQRRFIGTPGRMGQELAAQVLESARDGS